jgi:hypothetical protein
MSVAAMMSPQPHHHPHPPHLLRRRTVRIGGTSDLGLGPRQESTEIAHEHGGDQPGTNQAMFHGDLSCQSVLQVNGHCSLY